MADLLQIDVALARRAFELRAALSVGAETVALVGPSGAGKTSLLRTVAGLERPHAGRIAYAGDVWFDARQGVRVSPERRRVGYLPQDYGLFPHLDVAANVRFAGERDRPDLLERFGIAHLAHVRPRQLSGGERQRAALARALAREPRVLLLDEPFGALDALSRQRVRDDLVDVLADLRLPTLLVTHAFSDATSLGDRVGVIEHGRLVQIGPAADLLSNPGSPTVAALTGANLLDGEAIPTGPGAKVALAGGGALLSDTAASGPVRVAVYPWEIELADASASTLSDTVVSVRQDHGALLIRLTRLTIRTQLGEDGQAVTPGQTVGLWARPAHVRVFQDASEG